MTTTPPDMRALRYLVLGASLREASLNRRLATLAADEVERRGSLADLVGLGGFPMPLYSQDDQGSSGFPDGCEALKERLDAADGLIIASPEYNFSIPGALKNAIDWLSRYRPQPFKGKHALLMSASPSMAGGNRGLWALRVPLEHLGTHVYPDMFSLAQARDAFGPDGRLASTQLEERFEENVGAFMDLVEAATHYPCAKRHWVEFLGEEPAPSAAP